MNNNYFQQRRTDALSIIQAGVDATNSYQAVKRAIKWLSILP